MTIFYTKWASAIFDDLQGEDAALYRLQGFKIENVGFYLAIGT